MAQENNVNNDSSSAKATAGEVAYLKKQLEEAKAKCEEYLNGWKRERADFINFKNDPSSLNILLLSYLLISSVKTSLSEINIFL